MKHQSLLIVDGFVPVCESNLDNLRERVWDFAMDQRAFGPRKLLVAFADPDGHFRGLAYTDRTDTPLLGLAACLDYLGPGAAAAVALCDEPVPATPSQDFLERFEAARDIASDYHIHLVDWIACYDDRFPGDPPQNTHPERTA